MVSIIEGKNPVIELLKAGHPISKILLASNKRHRSAVHSIIAGFVEPGEDLEEAVRREVKEETGIGVANIRYFGSQSWPFPDSLMMGFIADYTEGEIQLDDEELSAADWYNVDAMPPIPPPGTISRRIINWYVENARDGAGESKTAPEQE